MATDGGTSEPGTSPPAGSGWPASPPGGPTPSVPGWSAPPPGAPPPPGAGWPPPAPGAPPGWYPPPAASPPTSPKAVWSIVLGALSVLASCTFVTGIPAIVVGRRAMKEVDASQGQLGGRNLALAGVIIGAVGSLLGAAMIAFFVFFGLLFASLPPPEEAFEQTPDEVALEDRWIDACSAALAEPAECRCAFDEVTRSLTGWETEDLLRSLERDLLLSRVQSLAVDAALAECEGPR